MRGSAGTGRISEWGLLAFALALAGCANVEVRGLVRDSQTQEPVPGATVRIGDRITATDSSGAFVMDVDSDDDPQRVDVSAPNYAAQIDHRPIREEPDPYYMTFDLQPAEAAQGAQRTREASGTLPASAPRIQVEATGPGAKVTIQDGNRRAEATVENDGESSRVEGQLNQAPPQ